MFKAEPSDNTKPPKAYLLGAPVDPLGQIAAAAKMYKGEMVTDLATVTDEERREYLKEIQKTALKMPLETVSLHFMLDNVHRGITHQMVRQRTAAYAQESTRFAVKEDMAKAVAYPPSLEGTLSFEELLDSAHKAMEIQGVSTTGMDVEDVMHWSPEWIKKEQQWRLKWDSAVEVVSDIYMELVNDGMPAEEARGLAPTNLLTRLNYITNLRSFYDTMAVRVSDQAQFEWRQVAMAYAMAMRDYGKSAEYKVWISREEYVRADADFLEMLEIDEPRERVLVVRSSSWQYEALMAEIKPIEFRIGGPAFGANFDRPSRIGERVRAFHSKGVPSSEWTTGSEKWNIPAIHPEEWLLDPKAARLGANEEFDIYGNRVPKGTGLHWYDGELAREEFDS